MNFKFLYLRSNVIQISYIGCNRLDLANRPNSPRDPWLEAVHKFCGPPPLVFPWSWTMIHLTWCAAGLLGNNVVYRRAALALQGGVFVSLSEHIQPSRKYNAFAVLFLLRTWPHLRRETPSGVKRGFLILSAITTPPIRNVEPTTQTNIPDPAYILCYRCRRL